MRALPMLLDFHDHNWQDRSTIHREAAGRLPYPLLKRLAPQRRSQRHLIDLPAVRIACRWFHAQALEAHQAQYLLHLLPLPRDLLSLFHHHYLLPMLLVHPHLCQGTKRLPLNGPAMFSAERRRQ